MTAPQDNLPAAPQPLGYATPAAPSGRVAISAMVCFVCGLVSLVMYGALVVEIIPRRRFRWLELMAVILLIVALVAAKLAYPRTRAARGRHLARAGLLLGFACLGIVLLFPLPHPSSPERYWNVRCQSNLRQIGQAIELYANDHGGRYPDAFPELFEEDLTASQFVCPATHDTPAPGPTTQVIASNLTAGGHLSYIYLGKGMTDKVSPDAVIAYEPLTNHQGAWMNVLYGDGHVDFVYAAYAKKMLAELSAGHNPPRAEKMK